MAGSICHPERDRVGSGMQQACGMWRLIWIHEIFFLMLPVLIGSFDLLAQWLHPFQTQLALRRPKQTCHGVALQLGCLTGSFYSSPWRNRNAFVRPAPACVLMSWAGITPNASLSVFVRSAENTPGWWSERPFGIDPPAGSVIVIMQQRCESWKLQGPQICSLRSTPLVNFQNDLLFLWFI